MVQFALSPSWFYGYDAVIDIISVIVPLLIAFYSYRLYRLTEETKYRYFALAFILISLSLVAKIVTNVNVYFSTAREISADLLTTVVEVVKTTNLLYRAGFFFHHFFMLLAFYLIYLVTKQNKDTGLMLLSVYFIGITSVLSNFVFFVFHISAAVLLFFIFWNYYVNYHERKRGAIYRVALSFLVLLFSQAVFAFSSIEKQLYVVGELMQLLGFMLLLGTYISITRR